MSDAPEPYVSKIDRRTALAWIGVTLAVWRHNDFVRPQLSRS